MLLKDIAISLKVIDSLSLHKPSNAQQFPINIIS